MKRFLLALALSWVALSSAPAQNVTCATRPLGDSSNACASTAFVQTNASGQGPVNVKLPPYNATGDGVTDDGPAIQLAATAACGTPGTPGSARNLYFPAGFYKSNTVGGIGFACGLMITGDSWSEDSGALLKSQVITSTAGLSGSFLIPCSTCAGFVGISNQAFTIKDIAVFYPSRPAAGSGIVGVNLASAAVATAPAPTAWNIGTVLDHVMIYGADINLTTTNLGQFTVHDSHFIMHATTGHLIQGPNIPYAGSWTLGPNNFYSSGSTVSCQHVKVWSGGGGHISNNVFYGCGSANSLPPFTTDGILFEPILNVAQNIMEPVKITNNTMEGLTNCIRFNGATPSQNAALLQFVIQGNQGWCLKNVVITPTATNGIWVIGGVIGPNYFAATTIAGVTTTTSNIDINGASDISISGEFALVKGAGGDTGTAVNVGVNTANICQSTSQIVTGSSTTMPATVPICLEGGTAGQIIVGQSSALPLWKTLSGECTLSAAGAMTCGNGITFHGNTDYAILSTDRVVALNAALTAARTWTMPAANSVPGGREICIMANFIAGVSAANPIVVTRAGADTINNGTAIGLAIPYDVWCLTSDGTSKWDLNKPVTGVTGGTYGTALLSPTIIVDAFGRVLSASNNTISKISSVTKQSFCPSGCTTTVASGGSGTYTPTTGMVYAIVQCIGSGGGGGGTASAGAGNNDWAGGGGSGGESKLIVSAATIGASKSIVIGALGAGGTAGNNAGGNGGDVCVTTSTCVSGQICAGKGGQGGSGNPGAGAATGGLGGVAGTGDLPGTGQPGGSGGAAINTFLPFGYGGSSNYGGGGRALIPAGNSQVAGDPATGFGSGGGGAATHGTGTSAAGGAGTAGVVFITEFIGQ